MTDANLHRSKGLQQIPAYLQPAGHSSGAIKPLYIEIGRELGPDDLKLLASSPKTQIFPIKQVRAIHHRQAQLVALGRPDNEVAAIVGTSVGRVRELRTNPAFADLVAYYQEQRLEIDFETHMRIQGKLVDILELTTNEIQDRLENETQLKVMKTQELRQLAEFAADRTIAPPRATQQGSSTPPTKIELNFGWSPKRKEAEAESAIVDVTPN